jgi:beta-galactosidase
VILSESVAAQVKDYIAGGGTVVAEARLAWNNERGFASPVIPGFGLDKVFGAREESIRPDTEPHVLIESTANLPGLRGGDSVAGAAFEEDLLPLTDSRVLAHFAGGGPAVVEHAYGKGKAILIGSFAGLAYQRIHHVSTRDLLLSLAASAGVTPEVIATGEGTAELEVRRLVSANRQFVFVFNHASAAADARINLRLPWHAKGATDLVTGQAVPVQASGDGIELRKDLAPDAIWVVSLERE